MQAITPNGTAIMYTTRTESAKACFKAATAAPITGRIDPGYRCESRIVLTRKRLDESWDVAGWKTRIGGSLRNIIGQVSCRCEC